MATKLWAIGLIAICAVLSGVAQVFFKLGSEKLSFDIISLLSNYYLIIGILLYNVSFILLMISFKYGELSVLYPIFGLSYVWVAVFSHYFIHEIISTQKIIGISVILAGITFLGIGSTK
jgi:undecaprenyl phosphate-alpha-L-ara4N flippase subunit ArnE